MTATPKYVRMQYDIERAKSLMTLHNIACLLVLENTKVVGILTRSAFLSLSVVRHQRFYFTGGYTNHYYVAQHLSIKV